MSAQSQQLALTIDGITIADEDGLYSLNDLYKAHGSTEPRHQPKRWLQLVRTKAVIEELKSDEFTGGNPVHKTNGKAGTFVCRELVYSYAMHISPRFEIAVIRAFDKDAQKKLRMARQQGEGIWHERRELGIYTRRDLTDTIQRYIDYATAQGSRGAQHYYSNITRTTRSIIGIDARDEVSEQELHLLSSAEFIVEKCIQECMAQGMPYKTLYTEIKRRLTVFRDLVVFLEMEELT